MFNYAGLMFNNAEIAAFSEPASKIVQGSQ